MAFDSLVDRLGSIDTMLVFVGLKEIETDSIFESKNTFQIAEKLTKLDIPWVLQSD